MAFMFMDLDVLLGGEGRRKGESENQATSGLHEAHNSPFGIEGDSNSVLNSTLLKCFDMLRRKMNKQQT